MMFVIYSRYREVTERDTIAGTMRIDQRRMRWICRAEDGRACRSGRGRAKRPAE